MEMIMSTDKTLQNDVLSELDWEPRVNAAHIGVSATAGVVTLTGHVENYAEKNAAEKAAWRVKGVKGIAEELEVRLPNGIKRSDDEIAEAALSRMSWDVSIPTNAVKVKVEDGYVTLTGEVPYHYQKEAAEHSVRSLFGVTGVTNQTTLKSRVNTADLGDSIRTALHRSWLFDPDTVTIKADGGKVKLGGTVSSWHDKEVAGRTAWAAKGATQVENHIAVVF
jgi:osmotically-inducible protein OsmY